MLCPAILQYQRQEVLKVNWKEYDDFSVTWGDTSIQTVVTARYTIEDSAIEVQIKISPSFPLKKPTIEGVKRAGVSEARFRSWMLNLTSMLSFGVSAGEL